MIVTLYLEVAGRIVKVMNIRYEDKEKLAAAWYRMYAGKMVTVFYKLESKLNYEKDQSNDHRETSEPVQLHAGYTENDQQRLSDTSTA